jgi:hypothetical protein
LPVVFLPSVAARPAPWGQQARQKRPGSTSSAGRPLFALNKTHFCQPKPTFSVSFAVWYMHPRHYLSGELAENQLARKGPVEMSCNNNTLRAVIELALGTAILRPAMN